MNSININTNLIKFETSKAYLIAMPHKSSYQGFTFWYPISLTRSRRSDYVLNLLIPDDFEFKLVKKTKQGNIIDEVILYADEILEEFEGRQARGSHSIELMSNIIKELVESGMSDAWIMKNIGMDAEELLRLKQLTGLQELFKDKDFSKAWTIEKGGANEIQATKEKQKM